MKAFLQQRLSNDDWEGVLGDRFPGTRSAKGPHHEVPWHPKLRGRTMRFPGMPPVPAELAFQDHQNQLRILWCILSFVRANVIEGG